jgi:glycosyltransferase involved in cell wall biosynthesis
METKMARQIPQTITRPVLRQIHSRRQADNKSDNMNKKFKKITLMIPCYNEEASIGQLIDDIPLEKIKSAGFKIEVLVIDNNSTDKTSIIAKSKGARVISEKSQGKGSAIRTGFASLPKDVDYIVMLDGDNTYKPSEILRLIEPLESGFADVIVGSRLEGKINGKAMTFSHRFANWIFTFLTRRLYNNANVTDTCTGYFAWTKHSIDVLNGHIKSKGFAIEAEMISKMSRLGLRIYSVPITYDPRPGQTHSKLSPFKDALKIIFMLIRNKRWKPQKEMRG